MSVATQTYQHVEHIVADGGSTDNSIEILRRHARPGLVWRSEPDRGQSDALNKAFASSHGEIIGWLNSDDAYFDRSVVEKVVSVFEKNPDVGVVYGHAVLADSNGLVLQILWVPRFSRTLLRLHDFIIQPAAFVRREVIGSTLVDEAFDYTMDYELWLRLSRSHRFLRLGQVLAVDRHHPGRKSYTLINVGRQDHARLALSYGIAQSLPGKLARKTWKIASRMVGATVIPSVIGQPTVPGIVRDGAFPLLVRQVATPRARM